MEHRWAIILAAGSSRRMGRQKLLLPYGDTTMIGAVTGLVLASGIERVLVVLGADRERIGKAVSGFPVETCFNKAHQSGMLSSVQCGIRYLPEEAASVLLFLGDQPGISPWVITEVMRAYGSSEKGIVLPVHFGRRGHPLMFDIKYKEEIGNLDPEKGLRALLHRYPGDILQVEVEDPAILADIDTREDYSKAKK